MRPLKLSLSAFGPFPNKETIDFTLLGKAPFFLINGPTGCGKSTLLDAICYALYGSTTGNERTGDQMRSDMAKPETVTELIFDFELGNRCFRIERKPEQWLPKKRGEGLTRQSHSALLCEHLPASDQVVTLASKLSDVNAQINQLMGLTADQFRQVMVIPQGKFRELLLASSKDREQIFGQLFNTRIYSRLEAILADKASGIKKEKESFDQQVQGVFDLVNVSDEEQLDLCLEQQKALLNSAKEIHHQKSGLFAQATLVHQQNMNVVERFNLRDELIKRLNALMLQQQDIEQKRQQLVHAQAALKLDRYFDAVENSRIKLQHWQQQSTQLKTQSVEHLKSLDQQRQKCFTTKQATAIIPEHQKKIYELEQIRSQYQRSVELNRVIKSAIIERDEKLRQVERQRSTILDIEKTLEGLASQRQQAEIEQQQWHQKQLELSKLNPIVVLFEQLELGKQQLSHNLSLQQSQQNRLTQVEQVEVSVKQNALALEQRWLLNRAAEIASQLQAGEGCPVCGSTEHPSPAQFSGDIVTKKQVDEARELHRIKLQAVTDVRSQLNIIQNEIQRITKEQQNIEEKLASLWNRDHDAFKVRVLDLKNEIAALSKSNPEAIIVTQNQLKEKLSQGSQSLEETARQLEAANIRLASMESELKSLQLDKNLTLEEIISEISRLSAWVEKLQKDETISADQLHQLEKQETVIATQLTNAEQETCQWKEVHHANKVAWERVLTESRFEDGDAYLSARLENDDVMQLERLVTEFDSTLAKIKSQLEPLNDELHDKPYPQLEKSQEEVRQAEIQSNDAMTKLSEIASKYDALAQAKSRIHILKEKNAALEERYKILGTLSDVANGKNHLRVSLHRFVLGVLLDDVLIQASTRLQHMSQGRYRLIRKNERSKGNASSGLDLLVEDSYTGKTRDVATLSGGESFIAALSLALALSDVVQAHSGGVRLDTLFIDEGFGSLDTESLDLAIQTLVDLQKGGRTIGIISHVNELKEQMESRIDISRGREGSVISLRP